MRIFAPDFTFTIASETLNIAKLQSYFKSTSTFGNRDILRFYKQFDPKIKISTIHWRVFNLVQAGVLSRVGRGIFTLGEDKNFVPQISYQTKKLYSKLHKQFPYLKICIWNTSIVNEFTLHQPGKFQTIVEVEKDALEPVFFFLQENKNNVFINPTPEVFSRYVSNEKDAIIIKSLVTEAPTQNVQGVPTITIEKMLVDIFSDETIFVTFQGHEKQIIFENAYRKYTIHENRMLRYADRQRKKESLNKYLNKVSIFRQQTK